MMFVCSLLAIARGQGSAPRGPLRGCYGATNASGQIGTHLDGARMFLA